MHKLRVKNLDKIENITYQIRTKLKIWCEMDRQNEIKIYRNRQEIEQDYENFKQNWELDAEQEAFNHKSGLVMSCSSLGKYDEIICYNLPEWQKQMGSEGLSDKEIHQYLVMLMKQFVIMVKKDTRINQVNAVEKTHRKEVTEIMRPLEMPPYLEDIAGIVKSEQRTKRKSERQHFKQVANWAQQMAKQRFINLNKRGR